MAPSREYIVVATSLPLYDSPQCSRLATEAWEGRHLRLCESGDSANSPPPFSDPAKVILCEDGYECWLAPDDAEKLISPAKDGQHYKAIMVGKKEIEERISEVIDFAIAAYGTPNRYLWGGTAGPDFDCSGLIQRSFSSAGIWIPRDAYQQEEYVEKVPNCELKRGDLIFFGVHKATHVGIVVEVPSSEACNITDYGRDGGAPPPLTFLHSSSPAHGHDCIELDTLAMHTGKEADHYYSIFRGGGRIVKGLLPNN